MTEITCTVEEFHRYLGPRIRNIIQAITKKKKKELNHICQNCKQKRELEAAHIKESSRKKMVEMLLNKYSVNEKGSKMIRVNLEEFEKEVIALHQPLEQYFRFLCAKCHMLYDSNKIDI